MKSEKITETNGGKDSAIVEFLRCSKCGEQITNYTKYCSNCGQKNLNRINEHNFN